MGLIYIPVLVRCLLGPLGLSFWLVFYSYLGNTAEF